MLDKIAMSIDVNDRKALLVLLLYVVFINHRCLNVMHMQCMLFSGYTVLRMQILLIFILK